MPKKYKSKRHSYCMPTRSSVIESMAKKKSNTSAYNFPTKTELDARANKETVQKIQAAEQRIAALTAERDSPNTTSARWLTIQNEINCLRVRLKYLTRNTDHIITCTLE